MRPPLTVNHFPLTKERERAAPFLSFSYSVNQLFVIVPSTGIGTRRRAPSWRSEGQERKAGVKQVRLLYLLPSSLNR